MTRVADLHEAWSKDAEYRAEFDRLGPEFALARALITARKQAHLTQAELAERMATTQSVVARLESGRGCPSTRTLEKVARATGTRLRIHFEPAEPARIGSFVLEGSRYDRLCDRPVARRHRRCAVVSRTGWKTIDAGRFSTAAGPRRRSTISGSMPGPSGTCAKMRSPGCSQAWTSMNAASG